jgi:hypothetical protein
MKFNPIKRILYTDKGEVIRKLNCPYRVTIPEPDTHIPQGDNICDICNCEIVDTTRFEDEALLQLSKNMNLCFKVEASQPNVRVIYIN